MFQPLVLLAFSLLLLGFLVGCVMYQAWMVSHMMASNERRKRIKTVWLFVMFLLGPLGTGTYGIFFSRDSGARRKGVILVSCLFIVVSCLGAFASELSAKSSPEFRELLFTTAERVLPPDQARRIQALAFAR